jgi:hypothetical protein
MRTLALPETTEPWSLTSLREKLIKIGAKVVSHGRYVTFQMGEVAVPRQIVPGGPAVDRAAAGTAGAGMSWLGLNGLRRREDYALSHGKPANSSAVSYALPGFGCQRGWLRSNFVGTHPSETENPVC